MFWGLVWSGQCDPRREGSSSLLGAFYDQPTIRVLHCTSNRPGDVCKAGEFLI